MSRDEVVISGISGSFPRSQNVKDLIKNLMDGIDMTDRDHNKWNEVSADVTSKIGAFNSSYEFDNEFFGISERMCMSMDPTTKMNMERAFEAILDAGINPAELRGSNTAVLFNNSIVETDLTLLHRETPDPYNILGRSRSLNANRLSFFLDLRGPSYALDCHYNGGLQGIYDAVQYIKDGVVDAALVCSGATILYPIISYQLKKMNMLDPEGDYRAYDADANGIVRGEGVAVMLLQRASDARRNHGTIVHVLNMGLFEKKDIIQVPLQENWTELFETFYRECKVDPSLVSYIEGDAFGHVEHEAKELNAIADFFCKKRTKENPLLLGSIKTNIGHTEGCANLCALTKLIIAMETDTIPPNLHYKTPNPLSKDLVNGTIKIVTKPTPLEGEYLAMNCLSLLGAYGHLLVKTNPKEKVKATPDPLVPHLVALSARNVEGMEKIISLIEEQPYDPEYYNLVNSAFNKEIIKNHPTRGYVLLPKQSASVRDHDFYSGQKKPLWYVFSGMGSQWPALGRDMLALRPFKESIDRSAKILEPHGVDLYDLLTNDDPNIFDKILNCFVVIVVVQVALVDVLKCLGIEPDGIIGHSVGEVSASYADGCLTQEQAVLCTYYRGLASTEVPTIPGMMAAVGLGYQQLKDKVPEGIEIACHNASDSCTLSGPKQLVFDYVSKLKADGVFAKAVNVNIPYHSKYIKEMGPVMLKYLKKVIPDGVERSPRWISTSYPESQWNTPEARICNADYHVHNLLGSVLFEEGSKHIPAEAVLVEIAPHGLLQAILKRSMSTCVNIPLTNRNAENQNAFFLKAIGNLYTKGVEMNVENLYAPITYPVSRGTDFTNQLATWNLFYDVNNSFYTSFNIKQDKTNMTIPIQLDQPGTVFKAYKQNGEVLLPVVTYFDFIRSVLADEEKANVESLVLDFTDLMLQKTPCLAKDRDLVILLRIMSFTGNFEIMHENHLALTGNVKKGELEPVKKSEADEVIQEIGHDEFYRDLLHGGHEFETILKTITKVVVGKKEWRAKIQHNNDFKLLLDGMIQLLTAFKANETGGKLIALKCIRKVCVGTFEDPSGEAEIVLDVTTEDVTSGNTKIIGADFVEIEDPLIKFNKEELNGLKEPIVQFPRDYTQVDSIQYNGVKVEGQQLGYNGVHKGKKVMGLAVADEKSAAINVDPILRWELPNKWSKQEAAPVPLNYILAYHAVSIVAQLSSNQSIMVTDISNKLGIACLRVALAITSQVYGSVETEEDKKKVLKLVPKMPAENIIVNTSKNNDSLTIAMVSLRPKGVDVIINTGSPALINVISHAARHFGIIVELSKELFETRGRLRNTYGFLRSLSLYSCWGNNVINSRSEEKELLQKLLAEGLAKGVVTPFTSADIKDWKYTQTVVFDNDSKVGRFECETDKAYLILGGDPYSWMAITEWFINRKAKNIIVVHPDDTLSSSLNKKLDELKTKANIVVKSTPKFSAELIDHIFSVSKAKIALTMLVEEADDSVVEALCQKDTFLVTVLSSESASVRFCEERSKKNQPTLTLLSNEPLNGKTRGFLSVFDRLLINEKNQVLQVQEKEKEEEGTLDAILPSTLEEVEELGREDLKQVRVFELGTCSIGAAKTTDTQPIFVIPGLTGRDRLIKKLRKFIIPVFIIDLPIHEKYSVSELASLIVPKVKKMSSGPFNILGVGWSGAVALEVVSQLEKVGEKVKLFLINGTLVELTKQWNSPKDMEVSLLSRPFNLDPKKIAKEDTWEKRLKLAVSSLPADKSILVTRGLSTLRDRLEKVFSQPKIQALSGKVMVVAQWNIPRSLLNWMSKEDVPLVAVPQSEDILGDKTMDVIEKRIENKQIEHKSHLKL